ncbi:dienelactone hydrolase family protein [Melanomma pulvis-pyrius CBS 109.77]|uniref:Dienelactone hydrolase family protein n=1 Tax=Melanomma pulvis-pyrius CBS 109.77 TaxID=1314802 RepID=A0A6A6X294_9PLEO|nr:dienelactone hydrolase family protein [Melanomma pulvis-pyrius CBS 109.77]
MSCENCKSGFSWNGTPTGTETTLAGKNAYVTGTSKSAAILIVHDIFGWTFANVRLLADHFAKEANATVYLPDFFGGEVIDDDVLENPEKRAAFDIPAFIGRNNKDLRYPEIKAAAQALKSEYPKVGAIGYCYGGWAILRLGADPSLVDAVSTAHPSLAEKSEFDGVKVPLQILAAETDQTFTPELKEYANKVIPTLGVPYEYVYFPGLVHGFAARGDESNKLQKEGLEKAKNNMVNFFSGFLH